MNAMNGTRPGIKKYSGIGRITVKNQFAYLADVVIRSLFLLVILYIFIQLWRVTYDGAGTTSIAGYRYDQLIWYLIISESIVMASPKLHLKVEDEVKSGSIAYLLSRPMSYLLYHYAEYLGEFAVRLIIHLIMGGLLGVVLFGLPDFGWGWAAFGPTVLGGITLNYCIRMSISLSAFWVEETQGLILVYDKLIFTVGGMLLPLEMFPGFLQQLCRLLPFQGIIYSPVHVLVDFDPAEWWITLAMQLTWVVVMSLLLMLVYRKGMRALHVNGG